MKSKAGRRPSAHQRTPSETTDAPEGELTSAARALAQKMQPDTRENEDGQLSFDLFGTPAQSTEPPSAPPRPTSSPKKPVAVETILPTELEAERQQRIAAEEKETAARYDLGYGHMGNGLTVWNRLEEEHGDYKTVAHIAPDRTVTFYAKDMPEAVKAQIQKIAMTSEMSTSATQDAPVFSVPPQVPEREQETDAVYYDGYKATKNAHPNSIVLFQVVKSYEIYYEDAKIAAPLLGLELTTRPGIAGPVDMCSFPIQNLSEQYIEKLRANHAVTITLYDADKGHMAYTMQPTKPERVPTVREVYEKYTPIVKEMVLADAAYQNACINSDKENAYLEGKKAILRAVRTIEDPIFLRQFFDNAIFFTRLRYNVLDSTYPILSQPQQEREQAQSDNDLDEVPYNFEFEYRQLSRLKSDCEYFLGAGGRAQKHLSEGGIEAQIAKMRELYDLVSEKPEWLTAEDIDRYEAQMQAGAVETTAPNYEATVTAEEAPLLSRLLANSGIESAQFVHSSGEVTFSFAASVRDAVEKLIAKLRAELSKAVSAAQSHLKSPDGPEWN